MNSQDYIGSIEACFVALRGRGVVWAPSDAALAARWCDEHVPIDVVVRVLGARVRAWRFRFGQGAPMPMHLGWYAPAVVQAVRSLGHFAAGSQPPAAYPVAVVANELPALAELLDPLPAWIAAEKHLAVRHAYQQSFKALDRLQRRSDDDLPGDAADEFADLPPAEAGIAKCRATQLRLIVAGLADAESAALQAAVASALGPLRQRFSAKALKTQAAAVQEAWLSQHLGVRWPAVAGWVDGAAEP